MQLIYTLVIGLLLCLYSSNINAFSSLEKEIFYISGQSITTSDCDTLVFLQGRKMPVIIVEANDVVVKFKECDGQNSVVSSVSKKDILTIKYGEQEDDNKVSIPKAAASEEVNEISVKKEDTPPPPPTPKRITPSPSSTPTIKSKLQTIGLRIGVNYATWKEKITNVDFQGTEDDLFYFPGTNIALPLTFNTSNNIDFQIELAWLQKGARIEFEKFKSEEVSRRSYTDARVNYIEVPLLLKHKGTLSQFAYNLYGGVSIGYLVSAIGKEKSKRITSTRRTYDRNFTKFDLNALTAKRTDVSAIVGADIAYPYGPGQFLFDLRYNFGLLNTEDAPNAIADIFNRSFGLSIGYKLSLTQ